MCEICEKGEWVNIDDCSIKRVKDNKIGYSDCDNVEIYLEIDFCPYCGQELK